MFAWEQGGQSGVGRSEGWQRGMEKLLRVMNDCGVVSTGVYKVKSYPISQFNICILSYIDYISIELKTK